MSQNLNQTRDNLHILVLKDCDSRDMNKAFEMHLKMQKKIDLLLCVLVQLPTKTTFGNLKQYFLP